MGERKAPTLPPTDQVRPPPPPVPPAREAMKRVAERLYVPQDVRRTESMATISELTERLEWLRRELRRFEDNAVALHSSLVRLGNDVEIAINRLKELEEGERP